MKTRFWKLTSCVGAVAVAILLIPGALAECGLPSKPIKPMTWHPLFGSAQPSLVRTAFDDDDEREPAIVGMWHVIFTANTMNGQPFNGMIDNAVVVWHGDGTEVMNSSRPAQDGNFCLGVWERTGRRTYLLNHIPWQGNLYGPSLPPEVVGKPNSGAQVIEKITLSPDGKSYSGTFSLHAYDTSGNVYASFTGVLSAKRITPSTAFSDLL